MLLDIAVRAWCGDRFILIDVAGEIDAETCSALTAVVDDVARTQRAVILDLTRVRLLSAAGLHCVDCLEDGVDSRRARYTSCARSRPSHAPC